MEQEVLKIDYPEINRRLWRGLREARKALMQAEQALKDTERDCQRICEAAAMEQLEALRERCGSEEEYRQKRCQLLQRTAGEMGKMWEY